MKIIELSCTTDKNGSLRIPRLVLREMDIRPGGQVKLAYLCDSGNTNTYNEFMITPDGVTATLDKYGQEVNDIDIPVELLGAAGIPDDSDIAITCGKGEIIIREAGLYDSPSELSELFAKLDAAPDKTSVSYEEGEADE